MKAPSTGRAPSTSDDMTVNLLLGAAAAAFTIAALFYTPAAFFAYLTNQAPPEFSLARLVVLFKNPAHPNVAWQVTNLPTHIYWILFCTLLALICVLVAVGAMIWKKAGRPQSKQWDPHRQPGLATLQDLSQQLTGKAIVKTGAYTRPGLNNPRPEDVGYAIGKSQGQAIYMSIEDSMILLGPARSGKGRGFVLPMLKQAPGAVVSTSVRAENMEKTMKARTAKDSPIAVFTTDPALVPQGMSVQKWSLTGGCENPETALRRAEALCANSSKGVENASFWSTLGQKIIAPLLHAAAIAGGGTPLLATWASSPTNAQAAIEILTASPLAADGWARNLAASLQGQDPRTLSNVWAQLEITITKPLMSPAIMNAVSPALGEALNVEDFIRRRGTLYIIDDSGGLAAAFIAALVEDFYLTARQIANASPSGRLEPPMFFSLDEVANIATLPSLGHMISAGGGSGITTCAVLQSLSQAREKWGTDTGQAIWQAATSRIILGGVVDSKDLEEISKLTGQRNVTDQTQQISEKTKTRSYSVKQETVLTAAQVRALPYGTAVLLTRAIPPVLLDTWAVMKP